MRRKRGREMREKELRGEKGRGRGIVIGDRHPSENYT